jgi:hypothetical protein
MEKKWYEGWYLTVAKSDSPSSPPYVEVELPNCPEMRRTKIYTSNDDHSLKSVANLLDKLLSELTHTEGAKLVGDGPPNT